VLNRNLYVRFAFDGEPQLAPSDLPIQLACITLTRSGQPCRVSRSASSFVCILWAFEKPLLICFCSTFVLRMASKPLPRPASLASTVWQREHQFHRRLFANKLVPVCEIARTAMCPVVIILVASGHFAFPVVTSAELLQPVRRALNFMLSRVHLPRWQFSRHALRFPQASRKHPQPHGVQNRLNPRMRRLFLRLSNIQQIV